MKSVFDIDIFQLAFALQILWAVASGLYKMSILFFYYEIFPNLRQICRVTMGFVFFMAFGSMIGTILACENIQDNWLLGVQETCGDRIVIFQVTGALNIATDVVVLLIPVRNILNIQLRRYRKLVLIVTLTLGWL